MATFPFLRLNNSDIMPVFELAKIGNKMLLPLFFVFFCTVVSTGKNGKKKTMRSPRFIMADVIAKYTRGGLEIPSNYGYFHSPRKFHTFSLRGTGAKIILDPGLNLPEPFDR